MLIAGPGFPAQGVAQTSALCIGALTPSSGHGQPPSDMVSTAVTSETPPSHVWLGPMDAQPGLHSSQLGSRSNAVYVCLLRGGSLTPQVTSVLIGLLAAKPDALCSHKALLLLGNISAAKVV